MNQKFKPRNAESEKKSRDNVKTETFAQVKESIGKVSGLKTMAIFSLVLGIFSIIFGATIVAGLGAGIAAIVLGVKYRNKKATEGNKMALAGIICGSLGASVSVLMILCFVWFGFGFLNVFSIVNNAQETIQGQYQQQIINKPKTSDQLEDDADTARCDILQSTLDNARSSNAQSRAMYDSVKGRLSGSVLASYESTMARTQSAFDQAQSDYNMNCNN